MEAWTRIATSHALSNSSYAGSPDFTSAPTTVCTSKVNRMESSRPPWTWAKPPNGSTSCEVYVWRCLKEDPGSGDQFFHFKLRDQFLLLDQMPTVPIEDLRSNVSGLSLIRVFHCVELSMSCWNRHHILVLFRNWSLVWIRFCLKTATKCVEVRSDRWRGKSYVI